MNDPQSGIFVEGTTAHHFLEYALDNMSDPTDFVAALTAAGAVSQEGVAIAFAFGPDLWSRLAQHCDLNWEPDEFRDFKAIDGGVGRRAPSTQSDLFVWVHGSDRSAVFDAAVAIHRLIGDVAELQVDQPAFRYRDNRDLTGFVDGSANPTGDDRFGVALIPGSDVGAGGSFVLGQRWVHDLPSFNELPVEEQEQVIGRTKADSVEFSADKMPPDAHIARVEVERDGVEQELYRRAAPYGTAGEHGLYFLAFACDQSRFDFLLSRMFGTAGDDVHDRLTDFTRPVTGSYWFAPDAGSLAKVMGK